MPALRAALGLGRRALGAVDVLLGVFGQVIFSRSRVAGGVLLLAAATDPITLLHGALAVGAAALGVRALGIDRGPLREGPFGYNALLVGAGVAFTFAAGPAAALLALLAVGLCVLVTASLEALLPRVLGLPVLSIPFVLVFALVLGLAPRFGLEPRGATGGPLDAGTLLLESLGSLVFAPRPAAGALVLLALFIHSRIAFLLALGAFALTTVPALAAAAPIDHGVALGLGLNAQLAAMALGGVYFVPSAASFALGGWGAVAAALLAAGLAGPLGRLGVPLLILPFNAAVWLTLSALRLRSADQAPRSVDFEPGSPEENLDYFRTRLARFDALYPVSFRLPFRGVWECTQGVDGAHTHQGPWREAFDFEVRDPRGSLFQGEGRTAEDHHCFRLPVLAAADGTVVKVVNDIADNAVGGVELEHNWGNLVLLCHAPGLYSLVAHLARGSVKVAAGQVVRQGEPVGLCGSSGRSPRPHLHFQLQRGPELGDQTLPCRFQDAVTPGPEGDRLTRALCPTEGLALRHLEPADEIGCHLRLLPGERRVFRHRGRAEHLDCYLDLLGRMALRSAETGAILYFHRTDEGFTVHDVVGPRASVLHLWRATLSRVPFEGSLSVRWRDVLPPTWAGGRLRRMLFDLVSPFVPGGGVEMDYHTTREGRHLVIEGASVRRDRRGEPLLRTRAVLAPDGGPLTLEVTAAGRTEVAQREEEHPFRTAVALDRWSLLSR
jgi:murein DD-endopeptidase MepM/ murein hydrolase activator NlpD/urea transporter